MPLPIKPPFAPMEAQLVDAIPEDVGWQYEPKWDGIFCSAFRDGDTEGLQSKAGQPLARYFPEVVEAVLALKAKRFVLDGEIVVPVDGQLSFDDLLQRIHPAASRVRKLAAETPGIFIVFDLLVDDRGTVLIEHPLRDRRKRLEQKFHDHGVKLLIAARLLPPLRTGVFLIAGTIRYPFLRFLAADGGFAVLGVGVLFFCGTWLLHYVHQ